MNTASTIVLDPVVERWLLEQATAFESWAAEQESLQRPILEELARRAEAVWADIDASGDLTT